MLTDSQQQERLSREVANARTAWHETRRELAGRHGPARPKDLFTLATSLASDGETEHDGRWAVVDEDDGGRLRLVPASTNHLVGPSDVKSTPSSPAGALVLHCDFALWLPAEELDTADRDGMLANEDVDRARAKLAEIDASGAVGTQRQQEARREPLYEKLVAELVESRSRLVESLRHASPAAVSRSIEDPLGFPGAPREPRRGAAWLYTPARLAAALLATLGAGFLFGLEWSSKPGMETEAPILGLPLAWLPPGEGLRGEVTTLPLSPEASHAVLILSLEAVPSHARYRMLVRRESGAEVWRAELSPGSSLELSAVLPRRILLPDGVGAMLEIELHGIGGEREEPVGRYLLMVEHSAPSTTNRR